jgi:hypothetical protein
MTQAAGGISAIKVACTVIGALPFLHSEHHTICA